MAFLLAQEIVEQDSIYCTRSLNMDSFLLTFHLKKPLPGVPNQFTIEIILLKH